MDEHLERILGDSQLSQQRASSGTPLVDDRSAPGRAIRIPDGIGTSLGDSR
jgi:hypothetical protein